MGALERGDTVFDDCGMPCTVIQAHAVLQERRCYRVTFSDGASVVADAEHLWSTEDHASRKSAARAVKPRRVAQVRTTEEIRATLLYGAREHNHSIRCALPLVCPQAQLPIDPYLLGYWLGNGHSAGAQITTMDVEVVHAFETAGYEMHPYRSSHSGRATTYGIVPMAPESRSGAPGRTHQVRGSFCTALRALGLLRAKRVPGAYLRGSIQQRRALLQGLFDSDGYCAVDGASVEYVSVNIGLARDVHELCLSLGYKATFHVGPALLNGRYVSDKYRITFTPNSAEPVFRVARKLRRQKPPGRQAQRARSRYIVAVEPVPSVPVRCITVDSPSRLYLVGREMIPTHNTRVIAEWVREQAEGGHAKRIALVAPTAADARDVIVEGDSGILRVCPDHFRPIFEPSKRRLTWPNGAIATTYSADEPERLRGPQHDAAVCDEIAAWRYPDAWDMLMFGLRLGRHPRAVVATTPKPVRLVRDLVKREGEDVIVTRGSTYENRSNLAAAFFDKIIRQYEGTRLGRQELLAELLEDVPGALWQRLLLDELRAREAPSLTRIVVAIDPATSTTEKSDETGIVVAGLGDDGHGYVLEDLSGHYSPVEWAKRAIAAYHTYKADRIVAEVNQGGDMVEATLRSVDDSVPYRAVHASRGKAIRAEPISALYEQRRVHHVGTFATLEDQMCAMTIDFDRKKMGYSPDRVDALVWCLTELMGVSDFEGWIEFVRRDAAQQRDRALSEIGRVPESPRDKPPEDPDGGDLREIYDRALKAAGIEADGGADNCAGCGKPVGNDRIYNGKAWHPACFRVF